MLPDEDLQNLIMTSCPFEDDGTQDKKNTLNYLFELNKNYCIHILKVRY